MHRVESFWEQRGSQVTLELWVFGAVELLRQLWRLPYLQCIQDVSRIWRNHILINGAVSTVDVDYNKTVPTADFRYI